MKRYAVKISSMFLLAWMASFVATAQFDDIYFDPEADELYVDTYEDKGGDTYVTEDYYYDDDEYDYYDDQDYYYSSRIRRFNRPSRSFGFYDPFFYDPFFIDPFFARPGLSLNFGFGNGFNRWNRWNRYAYGYDPFSYNPFFGGSRFNSLACYFGSPIGGFGYNSFYGGGFGYGRNIYNVNNFYGGSGYYESFQPVYGSNSRGTYYGARRSGAVSAAPGQTIRAPRVNNTRAISSSSGDAIRKSGTSRSNVSRSVDGINRTRTVNESARTYRTPRTVTKRYEGTVRKPSSSSNRRYAPTSSSSRTIDRNNQARVNRSATRSTPRSTYKPSTSARKSYTPNRSSTPRRSYTPSRSSTQNRSYTPRRSSNSNRSYTPSRSSSPSRSYSPSSSSRSSSTPSRSSSSSSRRR
ncbi:MAG: hypothetical protein HKN87_17865 [Saprospiraceae bacterium]|nr:hypothetical protein [Saprospiraceae bacterium]